MEFKKVTLTKDDIAEPIDDLITKMAREAAKSEDDYYFSVLLPYGVTRENYKDFEGRLEIVTHETGTFYRIKRISIFLDKVHIIDISEATIAEGVNKFRVERNVIWSRREAEFDLEGNNGRIQQ